MGVKVENPNYCGCESLLCDHNKPGGGVARCHRPADPRYVVWGVGQMCTECVSNMCATGGSNYVTLAK